MSQKGSISSPKHFLLTDIARTCLMPMTFCMAFLSDGSVTFPGQRGHAFDIFRALGSETKGKCPGLDKFLPNFRYISEPLKKGVARCDCVELAGSCQTPWHHIQRPETQSHAV